MGMRCLGPEQVDLHCLLLGGWLCGQWVVTVFRASSQGGCIPILALQ